MNIFHKVALQGLKKNRTRTLVTIIGVALSAALITVVATFAVSLQNYMVNGAISKSGDWHVAFLDVDPSFVQEQADDSRVKHVAAFENIGYAALEDGKNPDKPYLFISGFNGETFDTLPVNLLSGSLPKNSSEILIPAHLAANGGVQVLVGDTLTLALGARQAGDETLSQHDPYRDGEKLFIPSTEKTYTVVGIYQRPAFEEYSAPGYTLITKEDAASTSDSFTTFVTLEKPGRVRFYAGSAAEGHAYVLNDDVLRFMGLSDDTLFNTLLYSVGCISIALVMLGSVFLIYNSFNISLNERTHQFGLLMSIGATKKQLKNSVLFEGILIGLVGIPLGVLIGIPSVQFVISLVAKNFGNVLYDSVPLTLHISVPAIAAAAAISMITILISAYIPAKKAAGTPVMECIRQTNEIKVEAKSVKTSKLAEYFYGLEGTLALKNFKRNRRRYRSVVLSLTLSVVLFVSISTFGTAMNQTAEQSSVEMDGDISFYTNGMDENEFFHLYDKLKTADGVSKSTYQAMTAYSCKVDTEDLSSDFRVDVTGESVDLKMNVQFIEDGLFKDFIKDLGLSQEEYLGQNAKMIIVGKKMVDSLVIDLFKNSSMDFTIRSEDGKQMKTISTTFTDTYPLDPLPGDPSDTADYVFMVVAPYQAKSQFDTLDSPEKFGLTFWSENPARSTSQMQTMIDAAAVTSDYNLYNLHAILDETRNLSFIVNLFTVVFIVMITLIAVANVFNTISTNIRLRRQELAMLRSVGMSDRSFNRMMRFECALYGIRTLLLGLPIACVLSWLIYEGMFLGGASIDFIFPWSSIVISILGVFLVIFITMLYATNKIKKENIIDALRNDMT